MKVAVYTITKNEEQFIERWAKSCEEADYRLIVDTGSTDNTISVAIDNGCHVGSITVSPWRFDDARNAALAMLPDDIDLCIALDADEILTPGWRQAIDLVDSKVTRPRYKYVWSWNPDGSEGLVYYGDKIHARKGYRWRHPVHEVVTPVHDELQGWVGLEIHHHPDNTKSRSQYLPLLELAVQEQPNDDRNQFYLGREYMFNNMYDKAKVHLLKHLELSTWKAERSACMRYLGRVTGETEHWLLRACGEAPDRREPWVELAKFYYGNKDWMQSLSAAERAVNIKEKPLEYLCEAESWGSYPHDIACVSAWNLNLKERSIDHGILAYEKESYNVRLKNNVSLMYKLFATTKVSVVIPTKSNIDGLISVLNIINNNDIVENIYVIADGDKSYKSLSEKLTTYHKVNLLKVKEGSGIHVMWNKGLENIAEKHCLFLNDDVTVSSDTISILSGILDHQKHVGIICPNYDNRHLNSPFQYLDQTCRGRYNGRGGLAGFCMMLSADLVSQWRFDESMKWWYGDDDILYWVKRTVGRSAILTNLTDCSNNSSWTINNDPPKNFNEDVENDKKIFISKWGN